MRGHMTKRERVRMRGHGKSDPRDALRDRPGDRAGAARAGADRLAGAGPEAALRLPRPAAARSAPGRRIACTQTWSPSARATSSSCPRSPRRRSSTPPSGCSSTTTRSQAGLARRRIERIREIDAERRQVEREIRRRVRELGTGLVELVGVGELIAARIIGEVGDIARIPSNRHFASLNGTAPVPASSGQRQRHRLNRAGNRRMNKAIHMMALTQARMDPRARAYVARRRPKAAATAKPPARSSATSPTSSTASSAKTPPTHSPTTSDTDPREA